MNQVAFTRWEFVRHVIFREWPGAIWRVINLSIFHYSLYLFATIQSQKPGQAAGSSSLSALTLFVLLGSCFSIIGILYMKMQKRQADIGIMQAFGASYGEVTKFYLLEIFTLLCVAFLLGTPIWIKFFGLVQADGLLQAGNFNLSFTHVSHLLVSFVLATVICSGILMSLLWFILRQDAFRAIRRGR